MTRAPIRVAMVGAGQRAADQVIAMRRSGAATPVAFWNRTPELAHRRARDAGLDRGFDTIAEMIEATSPDVVSIVTHPSARVALLREAIDAGARAILLEKPIALTPAELDEVVALGDRAFIAVNTQYRWMTHWQRFWQTIADGGIGELRTIRASTGVDILEQGPHLLSLALSAGRAAGLPAPTWVLAGGGGEHPLGRVTVPADVVAVADLGDARLHLLAGPSAPRLPDEDVVFYQQQVEIVGTKGRIWSSLTRGWQLWTESGRDAGTTQWPRDDYQAQGALFEDLGDAVRDPSRQRDFPTVVNRVAVEADVLFACIDSARNGARVDVVERRRHSRADRPD